MTNNKYKIYDGFLSYKELLTTFNALLSEVKNITTIKQAEQWEKHHSPVEINGDPISLYISNGGTDKDIEWIRYEEYGELSYIYFYIEDGKINSISFDIHSEICDYDFSQDNNKMTQKEYYEIIEKYAQRHSALWVSNDNEILPDICLNHLNKIN